MFGTRVDVGAGFLVDESSCNIGLDRLRGGACILTGGQSLFVPSWFLPVIIALQLKDNVDKVHHSDANRQTLHKLDKQAVSLHLVSVFAQSELSKTWLEIQTGMEEWLSSGWRRATRLK